MTISTIVALVLASGSPDAATLPEQQDLVRAEPAPRLAWKLPHYPGMPSLPKVPRVPGAPRLP